MTRRLALAVALAAVLLLPGTAWATDATVTVSGSTNAFANASPTIGLGGVVQWQTLATTRVHSTTADKFATWSYDLPTGNNTSAGVSFERAGGFAYHCRFHGNMRGTVMVQMMASDTTPNASQLITITFATSAAPAGFTEQIQKRKAGGTWKTYANSTGTSINWTPPKAKTFQFRARYKQLGTGAYTSWSPILQLTVAP